MKNMYQLSIILYLPILLIMGCNSSENENNESNPVDKKTIRPATSKSGESIKQKVSDAIDSSRAVIMQIASYSINNGQLPSNNNHGLNNYETDIYSPYVSFLEVSPEGLVKITFQNIDEIINGQSLTLKPVLTLEPSPRFKWKCITDSIEQKYLPSRWCNSTK